MPYDLSSGDMGAPLYLGGPDSSVIGATPDYTLPDVYTAQTNTNFSSADPGTAIVPAGGSGSGSGIDWTAIGNGAITLGGAAYRAWGGSSGLGQTIGSAYTTIGGYFKPKKGAGADNAPPLDTSIPVKEPKGMGYIPRGTYGPVAPHASRTPLQAAGYGRPHMNPLNPKALRRAISRVYRFEGFAKRVLKITTPHKHVAGIKRHHRRRKHF